MNVPPLNICADLRRRLDESERALLDLVQNGDTPRQALNKEISDLEAVHSELTQRVSSLKPQAHTSDEIATALAGAETRLRQVNEVLSGKKAELAALASPNCGDASCLGEIVSEYLDLLPAWADSFFACIEPNADVRRTFGQMLSANQELRQLRYMNPFQLAATSDAVARIITIYDRARRGQITLLSDPAPPSKEILLTP